MSNNPNDQGKSANAQRAGNSAEQEDKDVAAKDQKGEKPVSATRGGEPNRSSQSSENTIDPTLQTEAVKNPG